MINLSHPHRFLGLTLKAGASVLLLVGTSVAQNGPGSFPLPSGGGGAGSSEVREPAVPGAALPVQSGRTTHQSLSDTGALTGVENTFVTEENFRSVPTGLETGEGGFTILDANSNNNAPSVVQDPESGIAGIMQGSGWRRLSTNLTSSELSLHHIALELTDPGVASGFGRALQQSSDINQLTFDSGQALIQQFALGGSQGMAEALSVVNCQRKHVLEQQQRGEQPNWQRARMDCMGALDITAAAGSAAGSVSSPTHDGRLFSLADDPALQSVDCQEVWRRFSSGDTQVNSLVDSRLSFVTEDYRQNFRNNWGDVLYTYSDQSQSTQGQATAPRRAANLTTCVVQPSRPFWEQAQEAELDHWKLMLEMLLRRCEAGVDQSGGTAGAGGGAGEYLPFDPAQRTTFYELGEEYISRFRFGKFKPKVGTIDILYNLFIVKEIGELSPEACRERLGPDSARNDLNRLKARQERTRHEHRAIHTLVINVVYGKMLQNAKRSIDELRTHAPGGMQLQGLTRLVARAVGLMDEAQVDVAIENNFEILTRYIEALEQQASMDSGKGVDLLRSPFDNQRDGVGIETGYGGN